MRSTKHLLPLFGITAVAIFAQTNQTSLFIPPLMSQYSPGSIGGAFLPLNPQYVVVQGEPFRAEINARRIKEEADGKQAVYESHDIIARDADGRLYEDHPASPVTTYPGGGGGNTFHQTHIFDPVAMTEMDWRDDLGFGLPFGDILPPAPFHHTISKTRLDPSVVLKNEPPQGACDDPFIHNDSRSSTERIQELGARTIQGLAAHGCQVSTSVPGNPSLNRPPNTIVQESWFSADLRLVLLRTRHDPGAKEDENRRARQHHARCARPELVRAAAGLHGQGCGR